MPVVGYFLGPILKAGQPTDVKLGKVDDFPIGVPQRVEVTLFRVSGWVTEQARQIAWVLRRTRTTGSWSSIRTVPTSDALITGLTTSSNSSVRAMTADSTSTGA